ncbi:hypothetical protein D3C73_1001120 [compost metagenome]
MLDHPTGHHVLGDSGDRRERNVDATGNQHHEQAAGKNAENGIAGGDVGQVAQRQKLAGANAQADGQQQHQQAKVKFVPPGQAGQ